jgi:hypothetical protein
MPRIRNLSLGAIDNRNQGVVILEAEMRGERES